MSFIDYPPKMTVRGVKQVNRMCYFTHEVMLLIIEWVRCSKYMCSLYNHITLMLDINLLNVFFKNQDVTYNVSLTMMLLPL